MAYRALSALSILTLVILIIACGPGTDDVTAGSTGDTPGTSDATTGPTTGPTTGATTGQTTSPTTGQTSDATTAQTSDVTTGQTSDATTGDDVCPDQFPQDGTPCTTEGQSCSTGCQDPCEFCNVVQCENGTWKSLEVHPFPCLDCESVCEFVLPAACAGGPPDQATCVAGCMDSLAGECKLPFDKMLGCIGTQPTFTCNAETRPTVACCYGEAIR